ncbi:MAG: ATP-binding protein [Deltaproteobacteria bacterium]|nr:ATP-binding protein [Deltaproteobacteria bacterium]
MKEQFLEVIVSEMETGVIVIDDKRNILYANPFFTKTFSAEGDLKGKRLADIVNDEMLLKTVDNVFSSKKGQPQEITIQGKKNQVLEARLVPFPMNTSRVVIGFFRDVTEEKRVEAIKRDFVANVSHELRTPLASIKGYAETLLDGAMNEPDTLKNFLSIINRHAGRMAVLIEDLLTLSMLESHHLPLKLEPVDIRALINSIIQGFEKNAGDKGLKLTADISDDISSVIADRVRLEQVIVNLVDNAIKYTNSGAVKVVVNIADNMLKVDVEDTGIGIPEKDIPRIFERFYRVDKGRSRDLGGTGLGLAIVKHIIQAHNGKIWVKSIPGKGTTYSFVLPFNSSVAA